jgi:hypothetical protein
MLISRLQMTWSEAGSCTGSKRVDGGMIFLTIFRALCIFFVSLR